MDGKPVRAEQQGRSCRICCAVMCRVARFGAVVLGAKSLAGRGFRLRVRPFSRHEAEVRRAGRRPTANRVLCTQLVDFVEFLHRSTASPGGEQWRWSGEV